jgi:HD-like signal output (HDOD) protein
VNDIVETKGLHLIEQKAVSLNGFKICIKNNMSVLNQFIKKNIKIPSPPNIAMRLLQAVKSDDSTYKELAQIISSDPALTARALKIANSSFYGLSRKVDSIERAISVLGVTALKNIALSFTISKGFSGKDSAGFNFNYFWKRAVTAAIAADLTAALIGKRSDDTFVTGLLQDIGILILYYCRTEEYVRLIEQKNPSGGQTAGGAFGN